MEKSKEPVACSPNLIPVDSCLQKASCIEQDLMEAIQQDFSNVGRQWIDQSESIYPYHITNPETANYLQDHDMMTASNNNLLSEITKQQNQMLIAMQQSNQNIVTSINSLQKLFLNSLNQLTSMFITFNQPILQTHVIENFMQKLQNNTEYVKPGDHGTKLVERGCQTDSVECKRNLLVQSHDNSPINMESSGTRSDVSTSCAWFKEEESEVCHDFTDDQSNSDRDKLHNSQKRKKHRYYHSHTFDGSESWKVWHRRFTISTKGWAREEKCTEMLLLLRGKAAEYVFDHIPKEALTDYKKLVKLLKFRFQKIEFPESYAIMFANRNQHPDESVQEYGIELTQLYDKAHPKRDSQSRKEDLLRRFLDGVTNKKAARQVEFSKSPSCIEDAIVSVVRFEEIQSRGEHQIPEFVQNKVHINQCKCSCACSQAELECPAKDNDFPIGMKIRQSRKVINAGRKRRKPGKHFVCYRCGGQNHIARNCRIQPLSMNPERSHHMSFEPPCHLINSTRLNSNFNH